MDIQFKSNTFELKTDYILGPNLCLHDDNEEEIPAESQGLGVGGLIGIISGILLTLIIVIILLVVVTRRKRETTDLTEPMNDED
jgi:hypothetical protein